MNSYHFDMNFKKSQPYLDRTLDTTATDFFDEALEMIFAIVVSDFLTSLDVSLGYDKDPTATVECLAVRPTRMIGVASGVVARTAIDIPLGVDIEHVTIIPEIPLARRNAFTYVFDDRRPLLDWNQGKQTQTGI